MGDKEFGRYGAVQCCALGDREFVDVAVSVVWLKRTANMYGGFAPLFIVLGGFCPNVGMCDIVKRAKLEQDHPITMGMLIDTHLPVCRLLQNAADAAVSPGKKKNSALCAKR